jgi:HSP20 family protein
MTVALIKREHRAAWPLEPTWTDERVDRMFRDMFRDFFSGSAMDRLFDGPSGLMRLEEFLDGDTCVIRAELPGIDPEKDVDITVAEGILHIQAHREERSEEEQPSGYRSEFRYGSFERGIRLPEGATEADVKASYKDGILEVRVPVAREKKTATRVPVEHG